METFAVKRPAAESGLAVCRSGRLSRKLRGTPAAALVCVASSAVFLQLGCTVAFVAGGQFVTRFPGQLAPKSKLAGLSRVAVKVANATEEIAPEALEQDAVKGGADTKPEPTADVDEQLAASAKVEKAKRALLRLAAVGNRGLGASADEQERAMQLVEELERSYSPPQDPSERRVALAGSWGIAFTTSPDLTSLDQVPLPGWRTGRIGQSFASMEGGSSGGEQDATNEITFVSPLGSRVNQTVQCTWSLSERDSEDSFKVRLTFVGSSTKLAAIAGMPFAPLPPLGLPLPPAAGIFEVSFLDDEMLIQRTRAGSRGVNVLVRDA